MRALCIIPGHGSVWLENVRPTSEGYVYGSVWEAFDGEVGGGSWMTMNFPWSHVLKMEQ